MMGKQSKDSKSDRKILGALPIDGVYLDDVRAMLFGVRRVSLQALLLYYGRGH